ncbi:hypothetical protein MMC30_009352 [Trapelia coarctata]|nr:hypothetical protein [Trapelia coarctata]
MPTVEVLPNSTSISAPGWAYVPDNGYDPSKAPIQPSGSRKRNARIPGAAGVESSARHNAAIQKRLLDLDKDNSKDVHIAVPSKQKEAGGRAPKGKTAATRKILLAQKTFTNYIADEDALALQEGQAGTSGRPRGTAAGLNRTTTTLSREVSSSVTPQTTNGGIGPGKIPTYQAFGAVPTLSNPGYDPADARLLQSSVPTPPSEQILNTLISAPSLSYNAAKALPSSSTKPQRHFCESCGYWAQIRCLKCGARVCGLVSEVPEGETRPPFEPTYYGPWLDIIASTANLNRKDIHVLPISNSDARLLLQAGKAALVTGRVPTSELEDLLDGFSAFVPTTVPKQGWFMRLDPMSCKATPGGSSQVYTVTGIIQRLATSFRAQGSFQQQLDMQQPIKLYLLLYNTAMDTSREFCVYCPPGGHITAISQYQWHKASTWTDEGLSTISTGVQGLHRFILHEIERIESSLKKTGFVFDVLYAEETGTVSARNIFQLIELNPFGALSGCGSCLPHWIRDWETLYNGDGRGSIPFVVSRLMATGLEARVKPSSV